VLERIVQEEETHLNDLKIELEGVIDQEKGLERAPIFLHFDPCELERLIPDLSAFETNGALRMEAKSCLEIAMQLEQRAAGFFREYADKFIETQGKKVFQRFADEELKHYETICRRAEESLSSPISI
ncbi:MAG TPA: hypothetical protein VE398_15035, partial [Acidobacteriota bacterium]|nr:hypothetical protein [Acidobacteriota bacterium]